MLDIFVRLHETADLKLLSDAIASVKAQTYQEFSIILLGQSLSPNKLNQVNELINNDRNIFLKNFELPKGDFRSYLLNQGFRHSHADYLAVLDYDDLVCKNSYQLLIADLERKNVDVSFGGVRKIIFDPSTSTTISTNDQAFLGAGTYYHFLNRPFLPIHSYVINNSSLKKKAIVLPSFPESLTYLEDSCFLAELLPKVNSSFTYVKKVLFEYRIRTDGESHLPTMTERQKKEWRKSQKYFYQRARQLKKEFPDIVFYENDDKFIKLKSSVVGFLNRHQSLHFIRDVLKTFFN